MAFTIHSIYRQIFRTWREKRFKLFKDKLQPSRDELLLDVGGWPSYWTDHKPVVRRVDSLNIRKVEFDSSAHPDHSIGILVGDGCNLDFPDKSYDIAYSNSVIEHVGPWENQVKFASELRRAGHRIWCQTPARECPLEPHYLAPFVHWLPKSAQRKILRYFTPWGLISRPTKQQVEEMVETTRLISKKEMKLLFPDCEILVEYLVPLVPKSYIAVRKAD